MSFVRLENLNDFIQPGTSCVKPVEKKAPGVVAKVQEISLSDCLACSGCITSSETVLVQQQNYEELFKVINQTKTSKVKTELVVSMSLQSITSLARKCSMEPQEAAEKIASFFISLGCHKVYDINLSRHISLIETHREFNDKENGLKKPIIGSACPGWICYAEKTNGELIIPHLSRVRSPQQIMGSLLKKLHRQTNSGELYHITLMPCFDKKLEASRGDFKNKFNDSPDVDCVLTPVELEEILNDEGVSLAEFDRRKLDVITDTHTELDNPLTSHSGFSTSGGYAENLLLAQAVNIYGKNCDELKNQLEFVNLKNSDFVEVNLKKDDNSTYDHSLLPKCAIVNGFRNIQTVVQRLKRNALKYDYIEIMACPSGCINGGAQCRPSDGEDQADVVSKSRELYKSVPGVTLSVDSSCSTNNQILTDLELNKPEARRDLLYTQFHPVPKMQNLTVNW